MVNSIKSVQASNAERTSVEIEVLHDVVLNIVANASGQKKVLSSKDSSLSVVSDDIDAVQKGLVKPIQRQSSSDDAKLNASWQAAKRLIAQINIILTATAIGLFVASFVEHREFWESWNSDVLWLVPLFAAANVTCWCLTAWVRKKVLERSGFTDAEITDILGPRHNFQLDEFRARHSRLTLKIVDGLPRKSNHMITSMFNIFMVSVLIDDDLVRIQVAFFAQLINLIVTGSLLNSSSLISRPFFGSSTRIRDGRFGRINLVLVKYVSLSTVLAIGAIMSFIREGMTESEKRLAIAIIYIPTSIGDALGEVIGSIFGSHEFKVWGIGEVNKKSIEGTLAVFLGSLLPMMIVGAVDMTANRFALFLIMSVVSTFFELAAPRGSDNFVLPVSNATIVYLWIRNVSSI